MGSGMPKHFDPDMTDRELIEEYGVSKRSVQRWRKQRRDSGHRVLGAEARLEGEEIRWRNKWISRPW